MGGLGSSIGNWINNNTAAAAVASHLLGAGAVTDSIAAASAIGNKLNSSGGYSNLEKLALLNALQNNNNSQSAQQIQTQAEDSAAQDAIDSTETESVANTRSAVNSGINKSRAGMLGESSSNSSLTNNYSDRYANYKSQSASTQADYLRSMGQMADTYNQYNNAKKGANSATLFGALSGASQGLSTGLSLSDEEMKESPKEEMKEDIDSLIDKFIELTERVNKLKGGK